MSVMFTTIGSGVRLGTNGRAVINGNRFGNRPYLCTISSNAVPATANRNRDRDGFHTRSPLGSICANAAESLTAGSGSGKVTLLDLRLLDSEGSESNRGPDLPQYSPGDCVQGMVRIRVEGGTVRFRSLSVGAQGGARASWTDPGGLAVTGKGYSAEREFFSIKEYIVSASTDGERHSLSEGDHTFTFRLQIPNYENFLATSFEGSFGSIRYYVRADLEQSWAATHRTRRQFNLLAPLDISQQELQKKVAAEKKQSLLFGCCWPCLEGDVTIVANARKKGYCPGESIPVTTSFTNTTHCNVRSEVSLIQTQAFHARGAAKVKKIKLGPGIKGIQESRPRTEDGDDEDEDEQCSVEASSTSCVTLEIPDTVCPTIDNDIVNVSYAVKISGVIRGLMSINVFLPIVVGSNGHRDPCNRARHPRLPSIQSNIIQREPLRRIEPPFLFDPAPPYQLEDESEPPPSYTEVTSSLAKPPPAYDEVDLVMLLIKDDAAADQDEEEQAEDGELLHSSPELKCTSV